MLRKLIIMLVIFGGLYGIYLYGTRNSEITLTESFDTEVSDDFKNVRFTVSGESVQLIGGTAEVKTEFGGVSTTTVRYFGNELHHDVDGDGVDDVVFLVTQETGGSGTFYYAVGALKRGDTYIGTNAVLIGDRIAPQATEAGEGARVVVNYADRAAGEPMSTQPSVGKSMVLLLDTDSMQFGEVVQNFEGEER